MISKEVELKNFSSLRVGGKGRAITISNQEELIEAILYARKEGLRVHIGGEGTNTFFGSDIKNLVVLKMDMKGVSFLTQGDDVMVTALCGESWDDVVRVCVEKKLFGIENLSGIPGTVGAAPVQNIGAYGVELESVVSSLTVLNQETLSIVTYTKNDCHFGYRNSIFKEKPGMFVIISVTMKLTHLVKPVLTYSPLDQLVGVQDLTPQTIRELVLTTRKGKLPDYHVYPNTGSFFKNLIITKQQADAMRELYPDIAIIASKDSYKVPTAWLIEHVAEMKGVRIGDVGTWPSQPLVLVNYGNATGKDVIAFSDLIISKIKEKTGIVLEREVNYVE